MNSNTRRIAAALTLTVVLAGAPSALARGRADDRDTSRVIEIVKRVLRFIGVSVNLEPTGPIPGSNTPNPNP